MSFNRESQRLTPNDFRREYTEYYRHRSEDSSREVRAFLIEHILYELDHLMAHARPYSSSSAGSSARSAHLSSVNSTEISILNIGAGKQILESEIAQHPHYRACSQNIAWHTGDIANIPKSDLLAQQKEYSHTQFDGSKLPYKSASMDLVISCMAIDFMPRKAFYEVQRVLKPNGVFLVTLHHPDLELIAKLSSGKSQYNPLGQMPQTSA